MYDRRTQQKRLRGWYEYFKHSHKTTFPRIDSWIRMRLRSILRKSRGGKGSAGAQAIRDGQMRTLRETRLYGSEGGEAKAFPTPIK